MTKILWPGAPNPTATIAANVTRYFQIGAVTQTTHGTEANAQMILDSAGTLSNLRVFVNANTVSATSTLKTRKNGADGAQSISITANTTGEFADNSNNDTVSAGEKWNLQLVAGATGTSMIIGSLNIQFAASTDTVSIFAVTDSNNFSTASTNYYQVIAARILGTGAVTATEANVQTKLKTDGTFKNLEVNVRTNARSTATTFTFRKNGSNGNQTISITASTTGFFSDTSNTDVCAVDDLVNYIVTTGTGTGNFQFWSSKDEFVTTNSQTMYSNSDLQSAAVNAGATSYGWIQGGFARSTTETDVKSTTNATFTVSKLACYVSANTIVGNGTIKFRKNGADGNQSVSITSLTTGFFEDASNSDSVTTTDAINLQINGGAAGTSMTVTVVTMLANFGGSAIKTKKGLAVASVKTYKGLPIASVKTAKGLV